MREKKIYLTEQEIPNSWYNMKADLPKQLPPMIMADTLKPPAIEMLERLFAKPLIEQELSNERYIEIPEEVKKLYTMYRPSPLIRANFLEEKLGLKSKLYFKYEGVSPSGSHKSNSAIAQAYYNKSIGMKRLVTETGAGQWGSALSMACKVFDLECVVYMVKVSYNQKPYRKMLMETYGATVIPSPSEHTSAGRAILAKTPNTSGSLAMAISEAIEDALEDDHSRYALGSVLSHVVLHQTIIGQEAKKQFELINEYPDVVVGCIGGGSSLTGMAFPFVQDKLTKDKDIRIVSVEPKACPKFTKGRYAYDFGDASGMTPLIPMYTLGNGFTPSSIHAGGLRYHGGNAELSLLIKEGIVEAKAIGQKDVFKAAVLFAQTEGIIPAPESSHAIAQAIIEAQNADAEGKPKTILFNLTGHGHFDMSAYDNYLSGEMQDIVPTDDEINESLKTIPKAPDISNY